MQREIIEVKSHYDADIESDDEGDSDDYLGDQDEDEDEEQSREDENQDHESQMTEGNEKKAEVRPKEILVELEQPEEQPKIDDSNIPEPGSNLLNYGKKKGYYFPPEKSEYSPFENWTKACFAILQAKHRFTKESYNDLITVLIHPSFVLDDIPKNYDQLKSTMRSLPLLPYHEITVSFFFLFFFFSFFFFLFSFFFFLFSFFLFFFSFPESKAIEFDSFFEIQNPKGPFVE